MSSTVKDTSSILTVQLKHINSAISKEAGMIISATELKQNLGKYLDLASNEPVIVTRRGKPDIRIEVASVAIKNQIKDLVGCVAGVPQDRASLLEEIAEMKLKRDDDDEDLD